MSKAKKLFYVIAVRPPKNWKPKHALDVPTALAEISSDDLSSAAAYAQGFNQRELDRPTGLWCVIVRSQTVR